MSDFSNLFESVNIWAASDVSADAVLQVETCLDSHLRARMEQVTDESTGREPYHLHVQAHTDTHKSEVLQQHYIFNLKWKEKISLCFCSNDFKARWCIVWVWLFAVGSQGHVSKEKVFWCKYLKRKTHISMVRKVKLNHKSYPAANSMSFYLFWSNTV